MDYNEARALRIERDPERERASASDTTVTATGAQTHTGDVLIQWRREAFSEGSRTRGKVTSTYECIEDAEEATAGTVVFEDE